MRPPGGSNFIPLLLLGLAACGKPAAEKAQAAPGNAAPPAELTLRVDSKGIRTVVAERKTLPDVLLVPARIQPDPTRVVRVFAPVGGRLISVAVRPGDRVRKGQAVALLESSDVSSARADYLKARADLEVKEKAVHRAAVLYENKVLAEKDYQQALADETVAKVELNRALDRLRVLAVDPEGTSNQFPVPAPLQGVVLDISAAPGEFSKSLDAPQPLCTLADLSTVWAVGDVFEKDVGGLKPGTPAEVMVSAYPEQKWKGSVAVVSDAVDPVTRTLKLRVVLPNTGARLKPEMFAQIRLLRSAAPAIVVPATAVLHEGMSVYLFVQKSPGHFEHRNVALGRTTDGQVEVTTGLGAGEIVVAEGALLLRAAATVE